MALSIMTRVYTLKFGENRLAGARYHKRRVVCANLAVEIVVDFHSLCIVWRKQSFVLFVVAIAKRRVATRTNSANANPFADLKNKMHAA